MAAHHVEPESEQGIRFEKAVEEVLRVEVGMGNDVRRGHVMGQVLEWRQIHEQERPRGQGEEQQRDERDQPRLRKICNPFRQEGQGAGR